MRQKRRLALLWFLLAYILPSLTWALVPQQIGMKDTKTADYTAAECSSCHAGSAGMMALHHLQAAPRGGKACTDCHRQSTDPVTQVTTTLFTGDCLACHQPGAQTHHVMGATITCRSCHGSVVDEYNGGHYIPTYPVGESTPKVFSTTPGSCDSESCHFSPYSQELMNPANTHHALFGTNPPAIDCSVCHELHSYPPPSPPVRVCERCHGINSLHNIQGYTGSDPANAVVTFLGETAGKGHAGDAADCRGCHTIDMPLPQLIGTVVPYVTGLSQAVVREGTATDLTVYGSGFMSRDASGSASSAPVISISGQVNFYLYPAVSGDSLKATLPALPAGTYSLTVLKSDKLSNRRTITVAPVAAVISEVAIADGHLTITGSGFGASDPILLENGPVTVNGTPCTVVSWSDTSIVIVAPASVPASAVVSVRTLFDTVTFVKEFKVTISSAVYSRGAATIRGTFFGVQDAASSVSVDGAPYTIATWSDSVITAYANYENPAPGATVKVSCSTGSATAPLLVRGAMPQQIGMRDIKPVNNSTAMCASCHVGGSSAMVQHHFMAVPGGSMACTDCHKEIVDPASGAVINLFTADCLACHKPNEAHHKRELMTDCRSCHGSVVDNGNDGHYIPAYAVGETTPRVMSCGSCHSPSPYDEALVNTNADTHHSILGTDYDVIQCTVCHSFNFSEPGSIRNCESCHSVKTLHTIQGYSGNDPAGAVVTFFGEAAGKGHVGDASDCRGCHGLDVPMVSGIGTIVPFVSGLSTTILKEGTATDLVVYGNGFMSRDADGSSSPVPQIAIVGAQSHVLTPTVSGNALSATLPALPAGIYHLSVTKGDKVSNRRVLTVVPPVAINAVTLGAGNFTISGTGFGAADPLLLRKKPITVNDVAGTVTSWSDTSITVALPAPLTTTSVIGVTTLFGSTTFVKEPPPVISSAEWIKGTVTITGTAFGTGAAGSSVAIDGSPCTIVSWSDTAITAVTSTDPVAGSTITVACAGESASLPLTVRRVEISSAEWIKGTLTVRGSGFGAVGAPDNALLINGVPCAASSWTDSAITATVSEPAANANVTVQSAWGAASSSVAVRKVTIVAAEWLLGKVTVTGSGFGAAGNTANTLVINGTPCAVTSWSDTAITASLAVAPPATSTVQVNAVYGSASAPLVVKKVTINSASWTKGRITITGDGFGAAGYTGNRIYMNNTLCAIVSWSNNTIIATYKNTPPNGATVRVQAAYGTATALLRRK